MSADLRHIARAGGLALASTAALITGLIQQDQLFGVGWVVASGVCSIGAVFLGDIAGGIAGAVRAALREPSAVEQAAIRAKTGPAAQRRVLAPGAEIEE